MDTGLVPAAANNPRGVYGDMVGELKISLTHEQRLDLQVEALGFRTDDVKYVIMSHLH